MTKCDHTVALFGDRLIFESQIDALVKSEAISANRHNRTMFCITNEKRFDKIIKAIDYLDRRKGLMDMFVFCPYCGEKVDWKKIKAEVTSENANRRQGQV